MDTVIIGAGQAGLALGYHLARQGRDFVILDAYPRVGDAWRRRWDSLRLFTPAKYDGLPGLRFPGDGLAFPSKDDVADYLEAYAARFQLPVRTGVRVERVTRIGDRYLVTGAGQSWEADTVVLATGGVQVPTSPAFAGQTAPDVLELHSSDYLNPEQLPPGPVLVVGLGNSGAEIALELSRTRQTFVAGEPSGELPVRHGRNTARFALPVVRFAAVHVLTLGTPVGRKAAPAMMTHAAPLIRTRRADLAAAGVRMVPRVAAIADGRPVLENGETLTVSTVLWCTGYREDFSFVDVPGFADGRRPAQRRGAVESAPGMYLLGQEFLYAAASGTLTGMLRDARYLARHMDASSPAAARRNPASTATSARMRHRATTG